MSKELEEGGASGAMMPGTSFEIGAAEPGYEAFVRYSKRLNGTSEATLRSYAQYLGMVRRLSPKPFLELDIDGIEALDMKLRKRAACLRTVLKMFLRASRRFDLDAALPRQRRPRRRRLGLDDVLTPGDVMDL